METARIDNMVLDTPHVSHTSNASGHVYMQRYLLCISGLSHPLQLTGLGLGLRTLSATNQYILHRSNGVLELA